jgi:hypothetical protein
MQAQGHGWIAPMTITTNYPVANSLAIRFPFPSQDEDYGWINEWVSACMEMKEHIGNQ